MRNERRSGHTTAALAVGLALALLAACAGERSAVPPFDPPDIEGWTGEPQVAAKIRNLRQQALEAPESVEAVGRLAMTFHAHDLLGEAVASYRRAALLEPEVPRWPYLAARATAKNDFEASIADFERAAALGLDQSAFHLSYGDVLARLGRSTEAEAEYRKALERDPAATYALAGLAQLALARGEPEVSAEHLEEAIRIAPWHGELHTLLAQVYQRLGRGEEAEFELLRAGAYPEVTAVSDPTLAAMEAEAVSTLAIRQRGERLAEQGRFAEAETQFRKVLEVSSDKVRDFANLGGALTAQGRLDEALKQYETALELDPKDAFTRNNLAMALADGGDLEGAAKQLAKAIAIDDTYADAHRNLGLVLARQGRHREATAQYRRALSRNPSLAKAQNDLGTALAAQGDLEGAMENWRQTVAIDPREISAYYNLSVGLVQRAKHGEAVGWLRRGLEIAPNSSRFVSLLAWELATAPDAGVRDAAEAGRLARRIFDAYPDRPQMADLLAAALASQGRFDEAIPVAERALAQAENAGQHALVAQIQLRLKLYGRRQPFHQGLLGPTSGAISSD